MPCSDNKKPGSNIQPHCYRSFYEMWISPEPDGRARVSTCCKNANLPGNSVILYENIQHAWNAKEFQTQRNKILNNDRNFCKGAFCLQFPYSFHSDFSSREPVKSALHLRQSVLTYPPKKVFISVSHNCNNKCTFCYRFLSNKISKMPSLNSRILQEIKVNIIPHAEAIIFTGGEPLFDKGSRGLIEWSLKNFPAKEYTFVTNGTLLNDFGLQRIVQQNIFLSISLYGMNKETYKKVTGTDNFYSVYRSIEELIKLGYPSMAVTFTFDYKSLNDIEAFCLFVEKNPSLKAIIRNNCYMPKRYFKRMRKAQKEFGHLSHRLMFDYEHACTKDIVARSAFQLFDFIKSKLFCAQT